MAEKKLSKKALNKSFRNWYYGHLTCFSQEHMQTFGYLCAMLPLVEELYETKEEQKKAMDTYTAFFNTEPQVGSVIVGITAGLEEARANGNEDVDSETINGLRAGLMGPIAGYRRFLISWYSDSNFIRYCIRVIFWWFYRRSYFLYRSMELNRNFRNALPLLQRI